LLSRSVIFATREFSFLKRIGLSATWGIFATFFGFGNTGRMLFGRSNCLQSRYSVFVLVLVEGNSNFDL